jgi:L-2-hydroxyglutarate oxidase
VSDVAIIGGGIVGLAVARALLHEHGILPVVLEAEERLASHQTGHNSGVIHSGLYYEPGSRKARDCVAGRDAMYAFCREHGVAYERCGKLVVATTEEQAGALEELERRGRTNGLDGILRVAADGLGEYEPHVRGRAGLWVPETGIVDFTRVAEALAAELRAKGATIRTGSRVRRVERRSAGFVLHGDGGELEASHLINCAGLQSDRVARLCGLDPGLRIVPFRGEYWQLAAGREGLVRNLVYPVPDPRLPFLGVHFTRKLGGGVEVGPNALLAWSRVSYSRAGFSARDALATLSYAGFWRLIARHWRFGVGELRRSLIKKAFVRDARRLVPDLGATDLERDGMGIRAQAVAPDGSIVDDFRILEAERMLHVLNAPSPAATASLAIGRYIATRAAPLLGKGAKGVKS